MFQHDLVEHWGGKEPAPEGREELVENIQKVWTDQGKFTLYIDGDKGNRTISNLKRTDLAVALRHASDWVVDWDSHLSVEQATFVRKYNLFFYRFAKVLFRGKAKCRQCGLKDNDKLLQCSQCKQVFYCCRDHQVADWPEHIKECWELKEQRNNKPYDFGGLSDIMDQLCIE